jgi:hypothetical protein
MLGPEDLAVFTAMVDQAKANQMIPTVSAAGALPVNAGLTLLDITDTKLWTLEDGSYPGQEWAFRVIGTSGTPDGTITPANMDNGTSIDVDAADEEGTLVWTGTAWQVKSILGATVTP